MSDPVFWYATLDIQYHTVDDHGNTVKESLTGFDGGKTLPLLNAPFGFEVAKQETRGNVKVKVKQLESKQVQLTFDLKDLFPHITPKSCRMSPTSYMLTPTIYLPGTEEKMVLPTVEVNTLFLARTLDYDETEYHREHSTAKKNSEIEKDWVKYDESLLTKYRTNEHSSLNETLKPTIKDSLTDEIISNTRLQFMDKGKVQVFDYIDVKASLNEKQQAKEPHGSAFVHFSIVDVRAEPEWCNFASFSTMTTPIFDRLIMRLPGGDFQSWLSQPVTLTKEALTAKYIAKSPVIPLEYTDEDDELAIPFDPTAFPVWAKSNLEELCKAVDADYAKKSPDDQKAKRLEVYVKTKQVIVENWDRANKNHHLLYLDWLTAKDLAGGDEDEEEEEEDE